MEERNVTPQDLQDIEALIDGREFDVALQRHLWFYETSKTTPGMGGVRLSFALESWLKLAKLYEPAMDALIQIKNTNKKVILGATGGFDEFHDFYAINRYLGNEGETYSVFLSIHEQQPDLARHCYHIVQDLLVERGMYELCKSFIDDPLEQYQRIEKLHQMNLKFMSKRSDLTDGAFEEYTRDSYVSKVEQLIKILSNSDNLDTAKQIQLKALSYLDAPEIRAAI